MENFPKVFTNITPTTLESLKKNEDRSSSSIFWGDFHLRQNYNNYFLNNSTIAFSDAIFVINFNIYGSAGKNESEAWRHLNKLCSVAENESEIGAKTRKAVDP